MIVETFRDGLLLSSLILLHPYKNDNTSKKNKTVFILSVFNL